MIDRDRPTAPRDLVAEVAAARAQRPAADPVRFGTLDALARRAASQQGEARQLLARRVDALLAEVQAADVHGVPPLRPPPRAALGALSGLVDRLGRGASASMPGAALPAASTSPSPLSRTAAPPPLKAVGAFKGTWSRLRVENRLRQALAQVPPLAGPLNTSHLVNRTLQAMRDLSPAYLDAFMSHVDTLQALEQSLAGLDAAPRAASSAPAEGRRRGAPHHGRKT